MKHRRLIRAALYLLVAWGAWRLWGMVKDDPILSLIFFIFGGAIVGFWFVKVVLPWMADSIGTSIFMSGEKVTPEAEDESKADEQGGEGEMKEGASPERKDESAS